MQQRISIILFLFFCGFFAFGAIEMPNDVKNVVQVEREKDFTLIRIPHEQSALIREGNILIRKDSIEEIRNDTIGSTERLEHWVEKNRKQLFICATGVLLSLFAGIAYLLILKRILRIDSYKQKVVPLKIQMFDSIRHQTALLIFLAGTFLASIPLLRETQELQSLAVRAFLALLAADIFWAFFSLTGVLDYMIRRIAEHSQNKMDDLLVSMIRKTLKIGIAIIAILFIGQSILGIDITALLAGAGVIGLAVAFASKDTLVHFFGAATIMLDKPFRIGDYIASGTVSGIVEEVGLRSTRIRTEDETLLIIPNSNLVDSVIHNRNRQNHLKYTFTVAVSYDTDVKGLKRAMELLHEIIDNYQGADRACFAPHVFISEMGDWSINIKVIMWLKTNDFNVMEKAKTEIILAIVERFGKENINMPFPTTSNLVTLNEPPKTT